MIHILIRYLGIKTKLLSYIQEEVNKISSPGATLLDLFAGSNIVSQSMACNRVIFTNDIQKYSYVVAKATVNIDKTFDYNEINISKVENSKFFKNNYEKIEKIFKKPLLLEKNIIENVYNNPTVENLKILKSFYENTPYVGHFNEILNVFKNLKKYYNFNYYKKLKEENEYMLFTLNYAMPYFSLNQAIYIDSFRCAIQKMYNNKEISETEYYVYLSLLIYGLECCVTSIGDHFAQPQIFKLIKEAKYQKGIEKLISKKRITLHDTLLEKQKEFNKMDFSKYNQENKCYNMNAIDLLKDESIMQKVDVIYIDPPYTNAHYSRFYHILETLVNYDYPDIEFNGRYSKNRFQSAFCQKKQAAKEFETMISLCSKQNKKIIISYSDTTQCLISYDEICSICKKYYKNIYINKIKYLYKNLGQKPNKVKGNELLIVCQEV